MRQTLLAAALVALAVAPASAASFDFAFSNISGAVSGSVTGTVVLPDGDGTFAAISVTVSSFPAALGLGTGPLNAMAAGVVSNLFTVTAGSIAEAEFIGTITPTAWLGLSDSAFATGTYLDALGGNDFGTTGVRDPDSTTLSFVAAAPASTVPLPAALPLLLSGIAALAALRRRAG